MKLGPSLIGAVVGGLVGVATQIALESSLGKEAVWFALVTGLLTGFGARVMAGEGMRRGSFVRASLVAFVALAAIFGGSYTSSEMIRKKNLAEYESAPTPPPMDQVAEDDTTDTPAADGAAASDDATASDEAGDSEADQPADDEAAPTTENEATEDEAAEEDATEEPDDQSATEDETSADQDEPAEPVRAPTPVDLSKYDSREAPRQKLNMFQLVFFVLGTLLAYELARGGGKPDHTA